MALPIHVYGDPVLREQADPIESDSEEIQTIIDEMVETMERASGIGLAGPQVGRTVRLFVIHTARVGEEASPEEQDEMGLTSEAVSEPLVVINPEILETSEETVAFEEGCLSIPGVQEKVTRSERIRMRFLDRRFEEQELEAGGLLARVLLHEYDHLEGVLFTDRISTLRQKLIKRSLREIARGDVEADYPLAVGEASS